jgi:hypothetical protein
LRRGIHRLSCGADGVVMVAAHRDRAGVDEAHHGIDGPFRIGAIANEIAEENHPIRAPRARIVEAPAKRLLVGMDIREDSQQHFFPPHRSHRVDLRPA